MTTNRLTRDELLQRALDMADSQSLDQKDRPGGVFHANALSIYWLQDAIDLFHRAFPWTGTLTSSALSITTSTNAYALPADYTMDVRDGVKIVQSSPRINKRLLRQDFSWLLDRDATVNNLGEPHSYIVRDTSLYLYPWPKTTYTGEFWYYKLPATLAASDRPNFPDDWTLVEYVRLRAREWMGEAEPGTAIGYGRKVIGELKKSGLGAETDNTSLPLDRNFFRPSGPGTANSSAWLGNTVPS